MNGPKTKSSNVPEDDEEGESESLLFLPPSIHCGAPTLPPSPSSQPRRLFLFRRGDDACDAGGGEGVGESCAERNVGNVNHRNLDNFDLNRATHLHANLGWADLDWRVTQLMVR